MDHNNLDLAVEPSSGIVPAPSHHLWAVLLAGGGGIRLRDLTRRIAGDSRPKQFCRIVGDESLFGQTRRRIAPLFQRDRQVFIFSRAHEPYYCEDLEDTSDSCIIEQPLNRGAGIAMAIAAVHVLMCDPDAIIGFSLVTITTPTTDPLDPRF
jgi:mannose-1-phosphate guanylyltransferase